MGSNLIITAFYKLHFLFTFSNTIFTLFTPPTFNVITDTAWGRRKHQFGNVKRGGDTHPFTQELRFKEFILWINPCKVVHGNTICNSKKLKTS